MDRHDGCQFNKSAMVTVVNHTDSAMYTDLAFDNPFLQTNLV